MNLWSIYESSVYPISQQTCLHICAHTQIHNLHLSEFPYNLISGIFSKAHNPDLHDQGM